MCENPSYEELEQKLRELEHAESERKKAEEALERKNEEQSILFDSVPVQLWYLKDADTYGKVNRVHSEFMGVQGGALENRLPDDFLPEDEARVNRENNIKAFNGREPFYAEEWRRDSKGNKRLIAVSRTPVLSPEGEVEYVLCTGSDITEQKKGEAGKSGYERLLNSTLKAVDSLIMVVDRDLRIVLCNWIDHEWVPEDERSSRPKCYKAMKNFDSPCEGCPPLKTFKDGRPRWYEDQNPIDGGYKEISVIPIFDETGSVEYVLESVRDVTERKQSQEKLRRSEQRFRSFVEDANDIIYELSPEGVFTYVSPNWIDFLGEPAEEAMGREFEPYVHPEDLQLCRDFLEKVVTTGQKQSGVEYRVKHRDGSWRWHFSNGAPMRDREGNVIGYTGIARDITDKKQAEEELRRNRRFLRDILDSIQDGITVLDKDLTIRYANRVMESWFAGNKPLEGRKCYSCYRSSSSPCAPCPSLRCIETGRTESDYLPGLPGSPVEWAEVYSYPMKDPATEEVSGVIEFMRDVTGKVKAEKELRESRERLDLALSGTQTGLWDWNVQTGEALFNEKWAEIVGYILEELEPVSIKTWTDLCHPEDLERSNLELEKHFAGRTDSYECEARVRHKDGSWIWVLDRGRVVEWDTSGNPLRMIGTHTNITARKQAEEALQENTAFLREVIDTSPTCIFVKDRDGRYVMVNKAIAELYDLNKEDMIGRTDMELSGLESLDTEEAERFIRDDREVISNQRSKSISEESLTQSDGTTRWFQTIKVPLTTSSMSDCLLGVAVDITEQKHSVDELRKRSDAMNASSEGLAILDAEKKFVYLNPACAGIYGYKEAGDLLGKSWDILFDWSERERAANRIFPLLKHHRAWRGEVAGRKKDGTVFPQEVSLTMLEDGGLLCVVQDITERKNYEKEYLELIDGMNDSAYVISFEGSFIAVNDTATRSLGYSREELLSMGPAGIDQCFGPGDIREMIEGMRSDERQVFETVHRRKDGGTFPVEISSSRITFRGTPAILSIARDLTERRKAEEEKAKLEEQFHQAQKMESIGRLAGGVAHDLNNLLSPILGYGEMLLEDAPANDPRRESIEEIVGAGKRSQALVRQLLAFSRKQPLRFQQIDINDLIRNFKKLLRRTIREDIKIRTKLAKSLPKVSGDIGQLEQVIMNLAVNAQDAMPQGGQLKIETSEAELSEGHTRGEEGVKPGRYVMAAVIDTGTGMDSSALDHMFEPFFTTKDKGQGTGLGMSTVYGIVNQHGGTIRAFSEPGLGTTIRIYLPASCEPGEAAETSSLKQAEKGGSETVLLAEDDQQARKLSSTVLKRMGYNVLIAENGLEALSLAEGHKEEIHLLLTDVIMPDINGRDLFNRVSALRPGIRVLYMSGYTDDVIAHHGVIDSGVEFIEKPFNIKTLSAKVREVLK